MKKVILFLWFGDEKPPYIEWTLENFRKMNPGWEIRYIEYSNKQLLDYKNQGDEILDATRPNKCFSYWVDDYKGKYLSMHEDELVIYCDLDCFPIAPFDNFIMQDKDSLPDWVTKIYCPNKHLQTTIALGSCGCVADDKFMFKSDLWCLCNNKSITFERFFQICKYTNLNEPLCIANSMIMNKSNIQQLRNRSVAFHNMEISLGDNFCIPQLTPIEHYYSRERNSLNLKNDIQ